MSAGRFGRVVLRSLALALARRPGVALMLHARGADEAARARLTAVATACAGQVIRTTAT